jgi:iron complex transport system permease protein
MTHRSAVLLAGTAALAVAALASLAVGSRSIALGDVWGALVDYDASTAQVVVRELRLPRTLLAVVAGAALGVAGALSQTVVGNRLADPGLLGVSAGAALAVVAAISAFGIASLTGYVWFAFVGAGAVSLLVFVFGSGRRSMSPVRLLLAGIAISAVADAVTAILLLVDQANLDQFRLWAVGSLTGRDLALVLQVTPFLLVGIVLALAIAARLDGLALGDDLAESLGVRVRRTRLLAGIAITLLAGAATAAMGPVAFLGLVAAIVARRAMGADHRWILPAAMLAGATVLLVSDIVGRLLVRPAELEVGVVLALVGGPVLIASVRSARRRTDATT